MMLMGQNGGGSAMPEGSSFAERLRSVREAAGLSQYALAKRSGLSKQAVSNLELGNREPTWTTVQVLALALGVDCRSFTDAGLRLPQEQEPQPRGRPRKGDAPEPSGEKPAPKRGRKSK
jgi:transcriptional regulator with XRE-family HTH domain